MGQEGHLVGRERCLAGPGGGPLGRHGQLAHDVDDLIRRGALLPGRDRDLLDGRGGVLDPLGDRVQGGDGPFGEDRPFADLADALLPHHSGDPHLLADLGDQALDAGRGLLGPLGELADLGGDDGEPAAVLAGPSGLDGRVQREQVGLLAQVVEQPHDATDLLHLLAQQRGAGRHRVDPVGDPVHGRHRLLDRPSAVLRQGQHLGGRPADALRRLGDLRRRGRQLPHGHRGVRDGCGLLARGRRLLGGQRPQLGRRAGELLAVGLRLAHEHPQPAHRLVQAVDQGADRLVVVVVRGHLRPQLPGRDLAQRVGDLAEPAREVVALRAGTTLLLGPLVDEPHRAQDPDSGDGDTQREQRQGQRAPVVDQAADGGTGGDDQPAAVAQHLLLGRGRHPHVGQPLGAQVDQAGRTGQPRQSRQVGRAGPVEGSPQRLDPTAVDDQVARPGVDDAQHHPGVDRAEDGGPQAVQRQRVVHDADRPALGGHDGRDAHHPLPAVRGGVGGGEVGVALAQRQRRTEVRLSGDRAEAARQHQSAGREPGRLTASRVGEPGRVQPSREHRVQVAQGVVDPVDRSASGGRLSGRVAGRGGEGPEGRVVREHQVDRPGPLEGLPEDGRGLLGRGGQLGVALLTGLALGPLAEDADRRGRHQHGDADDQRRHPHAAHRRVPPGSSAPGWPAWGVSAVDRRRLSRTGGVSGRRGSRAGPAGSARPPACRRPGRPARRPARARRRRARRPRPRRPWEERGSGGPRPGRPAWPGR